MQFFRKIFSQNTHTFFHLPKEVIIAIIFIFLTIFYPNIANAGILSFFSEIVGDQASAKTFDPQDIQNSQNMTVLKAVNNINPTSNSLKPIILASGDALVAEVGPSGTISDIQEQVNTQISLYVVRKGDTLSGIAKMFNVSVNTIIWANSLNNSPTLSEGQTFLILPISGVRYVVKSGDTIKGIVARYKADLDDVLLYNNITIDSTLTIGDTIILPDVEALISTPKFVKSSGRKTTLGRNPVHNADGPFYPGYYILPISGARQSQGLHGYNAIDLAAPSGTGIHASAGGTVIAATFNGGWNGGYGNFVIISHKNGTQTLYSHASRVLVSVGQNVVQGQLIAKVGKTGEATGPHLHFEIRGARNPF